MIPRLTPILVGLLLALVAGLAFQSWRLTNAQEKVADLEYDVESWSRGVTFLQEQLDTKERLSTRRAVELDKIRAESTRQKQQLQEIKQNAKADSCINALAEPGVLDLLRRNAAKTSGPAMSDTPGSRDSANTGADATD